MDKSLKPSKNKNMGCLGRTLWLIFFALLAVIPNFRVTMKRPISQDEMVDFKSDIESIRSAFNQENCAAALENFQQPNQENTSIFSDFDYCLKIIDMYKKIDEVVKVDSGCTSERKIIQVHSLVSCSVQYKLILNDESYVEEDFIWISVNKEKHKLYEVGYAFPNS